MSLCQSYAAQKAWWPSCTNREGVSAAESKLTTSPPQQACYHIFSLETSSPFFSATLPNRTIIRATGASLSSLIRSKTVSCALMQRKCCFKLAPRAPSVFWVNVWPGGQVSGLGDGGKGFRVCPWCPRAPSRLFRRSLRVAIEQQVLESLLTLQSFIHGTPPSLCTASCQSSPDFQI